MAMTGPVLLSLLLLAAGCYCAPASWLDIGGSLGYESNLNGTIGGNVKADRDGLSVNGSAGGIIGASWAPTLHARGHASLGDKVLAGDASFQTVIDNSWQPSLHGEVGYNSKGEWLLGLQPVSVLNNKLLLTPRLQVKTGDDGRKLVGLPLAPAIEDQNGANQQVMNAPGTYASAYPYGSNYYGSNLYGSNPYGFNPYGYNPYANSAPSSYGYNPYAAYTNMDPNTGYGAPNPYAAYYAQAMGQSQMPQEVKA